MTWLRFVPLVLKQVTRARVRSLLTIAGVALAMFLFSAIEGLRQGVEEATGDAAGDATLVVYRENRFCPFTSRLPESYQARMERIPGVASVTPMKVVVSNCRASLDVITFRGVRKEGFLASESGALALTAGSMQQWKARSDAALLGAELAGRRGFAVGDRFDANGVTVTVAGIFESDEPQHRNVAYVDLEFLQRAPGIDQVGIVTQFNVRVDDPTRLDEVATRIDEEFHSDQDPTTTRSEKAFVARAAADALELIGFSRWVALGCLAAVLALVANSIVLSVHDRIRDFAVLQTLGYTARLVGMLVVAEGMALAVVGGFVGSAGASALLSGGGWALSTEGLSIHVVTGPGIWLTGLAISLVLGAVAGVAPAIRAARLPLAECFRAV